MVRIQFELPEEKMQVLEALMKEANISTRKELFNNALTLSGTTTMEISKTGSVLTNDSISDAGALTYGGMLTVTHSGTTLAAGDSFPLFSASSRNGSFTSTNLPPLVEFLFLNYTG